MFVKFGTRSTPGMLGITARPPTLMKTRGALNCSLPTRITVGDSNLACAWKTVQFGLPRSHRSMPFLALTDTASARAFTRGMSTRTS